MITPPVYVTPSGHKYVERRRNKRNVHFTLIYGPGVNHGCSWDSWMPVEEWTRCIVTCETLKPFPYARPTP